MKENKHKDIDPYNEEIWDEEVIMERRPHSNKIYYLLSVMWINITYTIVVIMTLSCVLIFKDVSINLKNLFICYIPMLIIDFIFLLNFIFKNYEGVD